MEFEMNSYIVYVKTDDENRIAAVNSSAFLRDTDGWTEIDSGYGDKYHHAQGNYLSLPVYDERGICRYKLIEDAANEYGYAVQERTQEEMDAEYAARPAPAMTDRERIAALEEQIDMLLSGVTEDE